MAYAFVLGLLGIGAYYIPYGIRHTQARKLKQLCTKTRSLVLTYDDGPGAELTPRLLELLNSYRAQATFFLLGFRAKQNPAVIDQVVSEGHELGCHAQEHLHAWRCWPWKALADIEEGYQTLAQWIPPDGLFRPPCGKLILPTWLALRARRAPLGFWTIDSGDTHESLPDSEHALAAVKRDQGGVVLLHDFDRIPQRAEYVLRTTELLLKHAQAVGLTVRRLGDLLKLDKCAYQYRERERPAMEAVGR